MWVFMEAPDDLEESNQYKTPKRGHLPCTFLPFPSYMFDSLVENAFALNQESKHEWEQGTFPSHHLSLRA